MTVIVPDWNLDVAGAQRLEKELESTEGVVLVDLENVSFVASSGLRVLLKHAQRLQTGGGELRLCSANATVSDVFQMSGFDSILAVYDSRADAEV
jgi:anti-anti-sigma factor